MAYLVDHSPDMLTEKDLKSVPILCCHLEEKYLIFLPVTVRLSNKDKLFAVNKLWFSLLLGITVINIAVCLLEVLTCVCETGR